MPALPSSTLSSPLSLVARQQSSSTLVTVPSTYGGINNSPHPGIVVAIVLGSVLGFLLLLYLMYAALHGGPVIWTSGDNATTVGGMSTVTGDPSTYASRSAMSFNSRRDRSRRPKRGPAASMRSKSRTTVRSKERSRRRMSPLIVEPSTGGPIIVDPPPPRVIPMSGSSVLSEEDEIVVMEEHSPSPPRRSHSQRYRREPLYRDDYGPRDYSPGRRESRRYSRGQRD